MIVHQGGPGAGQHAKMVNQIAIAGGMIGVCEALLYAHRAGLDVATVLETISGGAAGSWSLSNLAPRALRGDFEPASRSTTSSRTSASRSPRRVAWTSRSPGLALAEQLYVATRARTGRGQRGTHALLLALAELSAVAWPAQDGVRLARAAGRRLPAAADGVLDQPLRAPPADADARLAFRRRWRAR